MLDLRTYGLKIQFNTTSKGHVDWIEEEIVYKQVQFSMSDFREMFHGLVTRTERLLFEELLFNSAEPTLDAESLPKITWSRLRDNPVNEQNGWNFLQDSRNAWGVDNPAKWLWRRVERLGKQKDFARSHNNELQWQHNVIDRYMKHVNESREKMLVLMHFTGGQPARAPEILSVRHRNTARGGHRNIFVEDGTIVFVTRGHKGYSLKGDVKIIHRYLPQEVATLLVYYLLLVLPFQQGLELVIWSKRQIYPFL